jgi:hypothetical protein
MNSKTDLANAVRPLAERMKAKKGVREPYVLCLGEGATLSSGCREMRWAVRETIAEEDPTALDDLLKKLGRPERCGGNKDEFNKLLSTVTEDQWYPPLRKKFFELLDPRTPLERQRHLDRFLVEGYPSFGYAFLVLLAREGFFNIILNANYDPLLEYALRRYLPPSYDPGSYVGPYRRLINRADPSVKAEIEKGFSLNKPPIKALWLNGHLTEMSGVAFTPSEKQEWYANVKDVVEKVFSQDLVLIGYMDRDWDIRRALENARGNGEVWFVAPEPPSGDIDLALQTRQHHIISGQAADFDIFCKILFDLTLDLDDPKKATGDPHRLELLRDKQEILKDYIGTLGRRQREDPTAPTTLQDQKEAFDREVKIIDKAIRG